MRKTSTAASAPPGEPARSSVVWRHAAAPFALPSGSFAARYLSGVRVPAGIGPKLTRDGGVGDHETNSVGDFFRLNQAAQLRFRQDVLVNVLLAQSAHHGCVGKAGMDDATTDTVEIRFLGEGGGGAFESSLRSGIGELALDSGGRDGANEDDHTLDVFAGEPAFLAFLEAVFRDPGQHFKRPVDGSDEI